MPETAAHGLSVLLGQTLAGRYELVRQRVHALVEPLTTEELWTRPFPFGNSVGHLLLHLTGNLSYYIGAQIAGTGYVRDRPREFSDTSRRPKEDVLGAFDSAVDMVVATLAAQRDQDWHAAYRAVGVDDDKDRLSIFVHCATHADHHAGQMIYLCKQLALRATGGPAGEAPGERGGHA
jgi:uncharacterized damage-inducible protein DinB